MVESSATCVEVAVALELPADHVVALQRAEPAHGLVAGGGDVVRAERRGRLHRDLGRHLEQVGDEHVEHGAGGVVELGAVGDVERLRHVDLHGRDVVAVPGAAEQAVGEAQGPQLLGGLLAEEVVDPEHLRLVEHLVHDPVELPEALQRRAEGLLVDHAGALGQPVRPEGARVVAEGGRRQAEVVHELGVLPDLAPHLGDAVEQLARVVGGEAAAGEAQPRAELVPRARPRASGRRTPRAPPGRRRGTRRRSSRGARCRSGATRRAGASPAPGGRTTAGPGAWPDPRWHRRARRRWGRGSRVRTRGHRARDRRARHPGPPPSGDVTAATRPAPGPPARSTRPGASPAAASRRSPAATAARRRRPPRRRPGTPRASRPSRSRARRPS